MTVEEVGHHEATTAESSEPRISYKLKMTIAHENQVYALFGYSEKIEKLMNMAAKDLHDVLAINNIQGQYVAIRYLCRLLERTLIKVRCRFAIESSKSSGYYRAQSEWRIVDLAPIDTPSIPIIDRVFDSITRNGEQTNSNDDDEHHYLLAWHSPPTNFKFVASAQYNDYHAMSNFMI
ncbi:hypothetical protein BDF22DRAFT_740274 [Syncephalis plumigaleata]|nr:hypothetical protein BDF22DRAFT_740274 [Syncephalis plumigaleata]